MSAGVASRSVVISAIGVGRSFDTVESRPPALDDVSLDVHAGEVLAVVGRSGSGKSTLLTILGALDRPDRGSVVMGDTVVSDLPEAGLTRLRRDSIGFVFQDAQLLGTMSVIENVALTAIVSGRRRPAWQERATSLLKGLELLHLADEMPSTLSGGEAQRVALARALFAEPVLLLADEPTGALDSASSTTVLRLLRRAVGPASAVVVVTHDLETACVADRIVVLKDGHLVAAGWFPQPVTSTEAERSAHEQRVRAWLSQHR